MTNPEQTSLQGATNVRIGDAAARTGLTPRTIRYYEQIGLLPGGPEHEKGRHRHYDEDDLERLQLITRLRDLLGLSLDELRQLVADGGAWLVPHRPWREDESMVERMGIVDEALAQIDRQIERVRARAVDVARLEDQLLARRLAIETKRLTGP